MRARFAVLLVTFAVASLSSAHAQEVLSPRLMIALDTSGSMTRTFDNQDTFGDGVLQNCTFSGSSWCGTNCTAGSLLDASNLPTRSRIYTAKAAIRNMIFAYSYVDWSLARFEQTTALNATCSYFLYDAGCPQGIPCVNYNGLCSGAGGEILVGFPDRGAFAGMDNSYAILSWIDNQETAFNAGTTEGNFCNAASGTTDCEIRTTGGTPLGALIDDVGSYITPIRAADPRSCRTYAAIVIADGDESCGGDPAASAASLLTSGIPTYVVGLGTTASLRTSLNAIATAGGTDAGDPGGDTAFFATNLTELSAGLSQIVQDSLVFETCDGTDEDCDGFIDEGVQNACGGCGEPPAETCNGADEDCDGIIDEGVLNACGNCLPLPSETCNRSDDDCDGIIDEDGMGGDVCAGCSPVAETCDGVDNDCDGTIDEGVTRACGSSVGACSQGTETCVVGGAGTFGACVGEVGPTTETCDGIDNDCDGSIDGFSQPCGGNGSRGICQPGTQLCVNGTFQSCVGEIVPRTEVCNGLDDDCDGSVDDGNPGGGGSCGSSVPPCSPGTFECQGGSLVCVGGNAGSPETCDNADNDCDAVIDEGNPGGGAQCGPMTDVGSCDFGVETCVMGSVQCVGATLPTAETCDTADNDCDGAVDEQNPGGGAACGNSNPPCMPGTLTCNPATGSLDCVGEVTGSAEMCDAIDNDCDLVVDEGIPVGAPCGSSVGECRPGVNVCNASTGGFDCQGGIGPEMETCDNLDNDCDGSIDEGLGLGGPCGASEGLCMPGTERCLNGRVVCEGEVGPTREACDCQDNDCDGTTDEAPMNGDLCPAGSTCFDCQCALPCVRREFGFDCPVGKAPRVEGEMCFCVEDLCDDTTCAAETVEQEGETRCAPENGDVSNCVCKNNECTFPCNGVVCADGLVCNPRDPNGRCVVNDCTGLGCAAGEICDVDTGVCEADPCASVTCGEGEACRDGVCEGSCASVQCGAGERCRAGACEADLCATVSCGTGEVCDADDGQCIDDLCRTVRCATGLVCDPMTGNCVADPCNNLTCPDAQVCEGGECVIPPEPGVDAGPADFDAGVPGDGRDRVLAAGGCSCRTAVPESQTPSGVWWMLGALGFWMLRRRRKVRLPVRTVGMLAGVLLVGCNVDPFCLDCRDNDAEVVGDSGTGVRDAGALPDSGPGDAGSDAGPGTDAQVADETCNGSDDDGDGNVDEGFDLTSDVENCGECDSLCAPLGAFPVCTNGECQIDSCDVGRLDINNDPSDGCEYRCLAESNDDAVCDLRDNDCDGSIDEDIDLQNDPLNCGSCAFTCQFANGQASCDSGACALGDCDDGWFDDDGDASNGCEYSCTLNNGGVELCNLVDDDCDGTIDEGDPEGGGSCGNTNGVCTAGVERCVGGTLECQGGVQPGTEVCGPAGAPADEDCDGNVDEGHPMRACGSSTGICRQGREECVDGSVVCVGETVPDASESCNGLDDDCDNAIDEGNPGGGGACGSATGSCTQGTFQCVGSTITCVGDTGPSVDLCDGQDNDCDSSIDEGFDLQNDASNCGVCGRSCSFANGFAACVSGSCELVGCEPGFVNDDGNEMNGCEYACSYRGAEVCNGIDDDCDTSTTEAMLTPPPNFCNPNGVCAGTTPTCTGAGGWVCNYTHPSYEAVETSCDAFDNDCNGIVNDPFPTLGNACGNGAGACRTTGTVVCDAMGTGTTCNAAPALTPGNEVCNGIDDDCDNAIDEAIALSRIPTVPVTGSGGGTVHVMMYEASRTDATSGDAGADNARACASPNVMPWTNVNWGDARNACCALNPTGTCGSSGWDLCEAADWQIACEAGSSCEWSYSTSCSVSSTTTCNGEEYDSNPGTPSADDDALFPTASTQFGTCFADLGASGVVYDLSGNAREWTRTETTSSTVHQIRGGSYNNIEPGRTCQFDFTSGNDTFAVPNTGFRCCFYCRSAAEACVENDECCSGSCTNGTCS